MSTLNYQHIVHRLNASARSDSLRKYLPYFFIGMAAFWLGGALMALWMLK